MKSFREIFGGHAIRERRTVVGSFAPFKRDIYKQTYLDPHKEMQQNWEAYMYNALINASLNTMTRFIFGNEGKVVSKDKRTEDFLNKFLETRNFDAEVKDVILKTKICGNAYLEVDFDPQTGLPDKFYSVADPSRMYVNFDKYGKPRDDDEAYLQRVDPIYNESDARWYEISYHIGYSYHKIRIKAIPIPGQKIIHFKLNKSINDIYGRADLTSAVNDNETLMELEKAMAMIVKYRAVPKKIIQIGDKDTPATVEDIENLQSYLDGLEMEENPIINKPVALQDLTFSGSEINLDYMIKHIRKKLIAGTAPEFLLGLGDEVNRATAHEQLVSFMMSVDTERTIFANLIEQRILKPLIKHYGLEKDTHYEFGALDFESQLDKGTRINQLWTANLITLNQAREELDYPAIPKGGDVFYADWVQSMGMMNKPDNPDHATFPKAAPQGGDLPSQDSSEPTEPTEPQGPGYQGQEPIRKPSENPALAAFQFSERSDLAGLRFIQGTYEKSIETFYVQAKDELVRDIQFFKEDLLQKKEIGVLFDIIESKTRPYVSSALKNAFVKGFKESARYVGMGDTAVKNNALEHLEDDSLKMITTLNKKEKKSFKKLLEDYFQRDKNTYELVAIVEKRFKLANFEAVRLVKSEITRLHAQGVKEAIKQTGVTNKYRWVTHSTKNSADLDLHLNGRVFEIGAKGTVEVVGREDTYKIPANPMPVKDTHPNCKCAIIPHIEL